MTIITQPQTLKVFGYIKKTNVMGLIYSGNSHNFVDNMIENQFNLFFYPTRDFQIAISGDKTTSCNGKHNRLELAINDYQLRPPMYAMVIGGVDIVLGAQWLDSTGIVGLNPQKKFLRYYENIKKYKFHGINNLPI
jgi:hypothetical protein